MKNKIVVFFSASGVTKKIALKMSEVIDADVLELEPVVKYSDSDLNWNDKNSRSTVEMKDEKSRPEIKKNNVVWDQYDVVFIGFPIWWYTYPRIINTFIEQNVLTDKKIILFATSGGSRIKSCLDNMRNEYSNLLVVDGKLVNSYSDINQITDLIKSLNL